MWYCNILLKKCTPLHLRVLDACCWQKASERYRKSCLWQKGLERYRNSCLWQKCTEKYRNNCLYCFRLYESWQWIKCEMQLLPHRLKNHLILRARVKIVITFRYFSLLADHEACWSFRSIVRPFCTTFFNSIYKGIDRSAQDSFINVVLVLPLPF